MAKKGGKKNKKKKAKITGPIPVTTTALIKERGKVLCPRLGDVYDRNEHVENILNEVAERNLIKVIDNQLASVNLSALKLRSLPNLRHFRDDLRCLVEINLSRNNLFDSEEIFDSLSSLDQLVKLNLSENFLNGMLSSKVGCLTSLEVLNLDVNNLSALCSEVSELKKLEIFTISDNSLTSLPIEASEWSSLRILNIKNNKIGDLENLPQFWPQLERIYAGMNLLTVIPFELGTCTKLIEMDFSHNQIQVIPLSLIECVNLELIHLGSNNIDSIPSELFQNLVKLKELYLYKNKITTIPSEIGNLKDIKKLSLSSNNIRGLPDEIGSCTMLEELYMNNNTKFSYFPSTAGHLRRLKELSLAKCQALKQFPVNALEMDSLKDLDLRAAKKQVCKITPEVVASLKSHFCHIRGGVIKKAKVKKAKKKSS